MYIVSKINQTTLSLQHATWNPSDKTTYVTLSSGDLVAGLYSSNIAFVRATIGKTGGKWFWEATLNTLDLSTLTSMGIANATYNKDSIQAFAEDTNGIGYYEGHYWYNAGGIDNFAGAEQGDTIGFALDADNRKLTCYHNGSSVGLSSVAVAGSGAIYPAVWFYANNIEWAANFGATSFTYPVPAGYHAGLFDLV